MQVEEAPSGRNKDAESKHEALRRQPSLSWRTQREFVCMCACVCASLSASLGVVTHTTTVQWGGERLSGYSMELIPQPVTRLSAAAIHTHADTHTYEHWSH